MQAPSDAELMRRVQGGDREAFAGLVDRHQRRLLRYLGALTRDPDRAQELAQEAFVRLFEQSDRYEERGRFLPYLYRMATNVLRTEERTRRRRELLLRGLPTNGHGRARSPQAECLGSELASRLGEAIAGLPLRFRSPVVLRHIEGWSYAEIARALGCSEGTVKSRIHRGREHLRRALEPYWNGGRGWAE